MSRSRERQVRLATVREEDQLTAIAGMLVHGASVGLAPEDFPDMACRQLFEAVRLARCEERRDILAAVESVRLAIGKRGVARGEALLAASIALSELEAPMRAKEVERNAQHLRRASEYRATLHELERARSEGDHSREAELAARLAELERGERTERKLVVLKASELEEKPLEWLWEGYLPRGVLALLASPPKCGKSTLTVSIAARVSCGAPWPSGPLLPSQRPSNAPRGDVLFICYEDDLERTVKPRLMASAADMDRVHFVRGIQRPPSRRHGGRGDAPKIDPIDLAEHLPEIERLVRALAVNLVVVDPVMSGFSAGRDTNADNEVRHVLGPLVRLAEETRATILLVTHTNKRGEGAALDSAIGSRAFTGLCRAVLGLARFNDRSGRRVFAPIGANLGSPRPGLVFEIKCRDGNEARSHIEWLGEYEGDMDDFRAEQRKREKDAGREGSDGRQEDCNRAMLEIVAHEKWIESTELDAMLEQRGHSATAVARARTKLKEERRIDCRKRGNQWWTGAYGTAPDGSRFLAASVDRLAELRAHALPERTGEDTGPPG